MSGASIVAIVLVVLAAVLLFARRDRARRVGGGSDQSSRVTQMNSEARGLRHDPVLRHLSDADCAEIEQEIASGKKIMAIKLVREKTGMGLKEAKDFVERFM